MAIFRNLFSDHFFSKFPLVQWPNPRSPPLNAIPDLYPEVSWHCFQPVAVPNLFTYWLEIPFESWNNRVGIMWSQVCPNWFLQIENSIPFLFSLAKKSLIAYPNCVFLPYSPFPSFHGGSSFPEFCQGARFHIQWKLPFLGVSSRKKTETDAEWSFLEFLRKYVNKIALKMNATLISGPKKMPKISILNWQKTESELFPWLTFFCETGR